MNPDDEKLSNDNILYAPDSFRNEEVQARDEALKKEMMDLKKLSLQGRHY